MIQNTTFNLRAATSDDIDILYQLICELAVYEKKDLATLPVTKENLLKFGFGQTPCFKVELAETKNGVVGYALYSYGFSGHQGKPFLYIDDLYVQPDERSQGIGSALLLQVIQHAKERGCSHLAFEWNEKAIAFYEKLGSALRKDFLVIRYML